MKILITTSQNVDNLWEKLLSHAARFFTPERFYRLESWMGTAGSLMAPVTALLLVGLGIIAAIKTDSFISFAASIAAVIAFFVAHWCGRALSANCDIAVTNSASRISGYGLFRSIALVASVGLIGFVVVAAYLAIKFSAIEPLYGPLGYASAILFLMWFLLNPVLLSIKEDSSSSPGDDALSLYIFGILYGVKLHRVVFGGGLILGNIAIAYSIIQIMRGNVEEVLMSGLAGFAGVITVFVAALAPLILYLGFVFSYLVIDLLRAVLRIGK
jgi:hypothetical protein